ncbi:MAG: glycosyltransferase [Rudaea sp.]
MHELAKRLSDRFRVIAVVPRAPGSKTHERLDDVEIVRYRYAPRRFETLVNDGGIVANLRRHRWKLLLVPTFVLAQAWVVWRLLRRRHVQVIHAHWLLPQGLIVALLGKITSNMPPFLVTSHGVDLFALHGRWLNALKRFVVRRAAAVTVVSTAMRVELMRIGADVTKVQIQPMGVDLKHRFTLDRSVTRSRDEILFVGRLVEKKGLAYLIDAMPAILARFPRAHLSVAGFGPERDALCAQVRHLVLDDKVRFLGAVSQPELPALYRRAGVFVAPFVQAASGDQEGLGLVLVEALGCGCALVVSDLPATRDVLGGRAGNIHVPAGNSAALADAVIRVLADVNAHWAGAAAAHADIERRFDWSNVSDRYAQILGVVG